MSDIEQMAHEAGFYASRSGNIFHGDSTQACNKALERFAALIRADERERCAALVESRAGPLRTGAYEALIAAADAIRRQA